MPGGGRGGEPCTGKQSADLRLDFERSWDPVVGDENFLLHREEAVAGVWRNMHKEAGPTTAKTRSNEPQQARGCGEPSLKEPGAGNPGNLPFHPTGRKTAASGGIGAPVAGVLSRLPNTPLARRL